MSLVHEPEMTEQNLAAHRANGANSQGAVTPQGQARVAAANLRHGFYAKAQNGALAALGEEDPEEYEITREPGGACGCPGREIAADAKDGRFQPAPIVAAHQHAFQSEKRSADP